MDRLMCGAMEEANSKRAELQDVSVEDFIRFCEYAYRGDYATPVCAVDGTEAASEESEVAPDESISNPYEEDPSAVLSETYNRPAKIKGKKASKGWYSPPYEPVPSPPKPYKLSDFRKDYQSRMYEAEITGRFKPQSNTTSKQDFTPVFLAHARLYAFAHYRLVDDLKLLCLGKLHKTLVAFRLYDDRVCDIVELVRYTYSDPNIPNRDSDGEIDKLKDLVVGFVVSEYDTIGKSAVFAELLEKGGEFVSDFWRTLLKIIP